MISFQILDEAVCISDRANTLGNQTIFPPSMSNWLKYLILVLQTI